MPLDESLIMARRIEIPLIGGPFGETKSRVDVTGGCSPIFDRFALADNDGKLHWYRLDEIDMTYTYEGTSQ